MSGRLERYRDMAPQHLRMARRMLDGWGGFDAKSMPAELRRFAAGDGCDAVDLAGRLLAGALEYLRFALEMIEDEEGRMGEIELTRRYHDSKPEDITDAYMRGMAAGMEIADSQHNRRIDALERRIAAIERKLAHKTREDA